VELLALTIGKGGATFAQLTAHKYHEFTNCSLISPAPFRKRRDRSNYIYRLVVGMWLIYL